MAFTCLFLTGFGLSHWFSKLNSSEIENKIAVDQIFLNEGRWVSATNSELKIEVHSVSKDKERIEFELLTSHSNWRAKNFVLIKATEQYQPYYWLLSRFLEREGYLVERRELINVALDENNSGLYEIVSKQDAEASNKIVPDNKRHRNALIRAFAIFDIFVAWPYLDQTRLENEKLRFSFNKKSVTTYYDPYGSKIINLGPWQSETIASWVKSVLRDDEGWLLYRQELLRASDKERLKTFFVEVAPEFRKIMAAYQQLSSGPNSGLERLQTRIFDNSMYLHRQHISPVGNIRANFQSLSDGRLVIKAANRRMFPIDIKRVRFKTLSALPQASENVYRLKGKPDKGVMSYDTLVFKFKDTSVSIPLAERPLIQLEYKLLGGEKLHVEEILPYSQMDEYELQNDPLLSHKTDFKNAPFLKEENGKIILRAGRWKLKSDLVLPQGSIIEAEPGFELDLMDGAKVITYSAVHFSGTPEKPIRFFSSDGSGQGLAVFNTHQESHLSHVTFENLAHLSQNQWNLSGAVTFYEAPVTLANCRFIKNRAQASLNIARTQFTLTDSYFDSSGGDSLAVDFGKGKIEKTQFLNSKKDAVTLVNSEVEIKNCQMNKTGDKAISAAEGSVAHILDTQIVQAKLGLLSKDSSLVSFDNVGIENAEIGISAFREKDFFAASSVVGQQLQMRQLQKEVFLEQGSTATLNGNRFFGQQKNLAKTIYKK